MDPDALQPWEVEQIGKKYAFQISELMVITGRYFVAGRKNLSDLHKRLHKYRGKMREMLEVKVIYAGIDSRDDGFFNDVSI